MGQGSITRGGRGGYLPRNIVSVDQDEVSRDEIISLLEENRLEFSEKGTQITICECPFCHTIRDDSDRYKLYLSTEKNGVFFCHRCGNRGSWHQFRSMLGVGNGRRGSSGNVHRRHYHPPSFQSPQYRQRYVGQGGRVSREHRSKQEYNQTLYRGHQYPQERQQQSGKAPRQQQGQQQQQREQQPQYNGMVQSAFGMLENELGFRSSRRLPPQSDMIVYHQDLLERDAYPEVLGKSP